MSMNSFISDCFITGDLNAKVDGDKNTPKAAPVISQGEQSQSSSVSLHGV